MAEGKQSTILLEAEAKRKARVMMGEADEKYAKMVRCHHSHHHHLTYQILQINYIILYIYSTKSVLNALYFLLLRE